LDKGGNQWEARRQRRVFRYQLRKPQPEDFQDPKMLTMLESVYHDESLARHFLNELSLNKNEQFDIVILSRRDNKTLAGFYAYEPKERMLNEIAVHPDNKATGAADILLEHLKRNLTRRHPRAFKADIARQSTIAKPQFGLFELLRGSSESPAQFAERAVVRLRDALDMRSVVTFARAEVRGFQNEDLNRFLRATDFILMQQEEDPKPLKAVEELKGLVQRARGDFKSDEGELFDSILKSSFNKKDSLRRFKTQVLARAMAKNPSDSELLKDLKNQLDELGEALQGLQKNRVIHHFEKMEELAGELVQNYGEPLQGELQRMGAELLKGVFNFKLPSSPLPNVESLKVGDVLFRQTVLGKRSGSISAFVVAVEPKHISLLDEEGNLLLLPLDSLKNAYPFILHRAEVRALEFPDAVRVPVEIVRSYVSSEEEKKDFKRRFFRREGEVLTAPVIRDPLYSHYLATMHGRTIFSEPSPRKMRQGIWTRVVKGAGLVTTHMGVSFGYATSRKMFNTQRFRGGETAEIAGHSADIALKMQVAFQEALRMGDPTVTRAFNQYHVKEAPVLKPLYLLRPLQIPIKEKGELRLMKAEEALRRAGVPEEVLQDRAVFVYEVPLMDRVSDDMTHPRFEEKLPRVKLQAVYGTGTLPQQKLEQFSARLAVAVHLMHQFLQGTFTVKIGEGHPSSLDATNVTLTGHVVDLDTAHVEGAMEVEKELDSLLAHNVILTMAHRLGISRETGTAVFTDLLNLSSRAEVPPAAPPGTLPSSAPFEPRAEVRAGEEEFKELSLNQLAKYLSPDSKGKTHYGAASKMVAHMNEFDVRRFSKSDAAKLLDLIRQTLDQPQDNPKLRAVSARMVRVLPYVLDRASIEKNEEVPYLRMLTQLLSQSQDHRYRLRAVAAEALGPMGSSQPEKIQRETARALIQAAKNHSGPQASMPINVASLHSLLPLKKFRPQTLHLLRTVLQEENRVPIRVAAAEVIEQIGPAAADFVLKDLVASLTSRRLQTYRERFAFLAAIERMELKKIKVHADELEQMLKRFQAQNTERNGSYLQFDKAMVILIKRLKPESEVAPRPPRQRRYSSQETEPHGRAEVRVGEIFVKELLKESFGTTLRLLRENIKMSGPTLALKAGINQSQLSRAERDESGLNSHNFSKLLLTLANEYEKRGLLMPEETMGALLVSAAMEKIDFKSEGWVLISSPISLDEGFPRQKLLEEIRGQSFGVTLRLLREKLNISMRTLASKAGINQAQLSRAERDERYLTSHNFSKLILTLIKEYKERGFLAPKEVMNALLIRPRFEKNIESKVSDRKTRSEARTSEEIGTRREEIKTKNPSPNASSLSALFPRAEVRSSGPLLGGAELVKKLEAQTTFTDEKTTIQTGIIPDALRPSRPMPSINTSLPAAQQIWGAVMGELPIQPLLATLQPVVADRPYAARAEVRDVMRAIVRVATEVPEGQPIWSEKDLRAWNVFKVVSEVWMERGLSSDQRALRALSPKTGSHQTPFDALMAKAKSHALTTPGATVLFLDRMPSRSEVRASLISAILNPIVQEIILAPGVVATEEDQKKFAELQAEAGRLVPDGRVNLVYAKSQEDLDPILSVLSRRLYDRAVQTLHAPVDLDQFKEHILVSVEKSVWDKLKLDARVEKKLQRALYNFALKDSNFLGMGSVLSVALALDVLPDPEKRKIRVGPGNYLIEERDFLASLYFEAVLNALKALSYSA